MFKILAFLIVNLIVGVSFSQSIERSVIGSMGSFFQFGSNSIEFTIGETFTNTLTNQSDRITQGFHQGRKLKIGIGNPGNIGLDEINDGLVSIFPNPTTKTLAIQLNGINFQEWQIYDVAGRLVTNETVNGNNFEIDVEKLQIGVYHISLLGIDEIYKTEFIKI